MNLSADGYMKDEVNHRTDENQMAGGASRHLWRQKMLSMEEEGNV